MNENYIKMAKDAGYTGSDDFLVHVGMACERGDCAWSWYEFGNDIHDVAGIFKYSDEEPNYDATIAAYAEGAANDYGLN